MFTLSQSTVSLHLSILQGPPEVTFRNIEYKTVNRGVFTRFLTSFTSFDQAENMAASTTTCTRRGCGKSFDPQDNDASVCEFHPGVPGELRYNRARESLGSTSLNY